MPDTAPTVRVDVKSAWASKINWTQAVSAVAMVLTLVSGGELNITAEQQLNIVAAIGILSSIVTWVLKTWFTTTVTPSSVTPPSSNPPAQVGGKIPPLGG